MLAILQPRIFISRLHRHRPGPVTLLAIVVALNWALSARAEEAVTPRRDVILSSNWRFMQRDVDNAHDPAFDDAAWTTVQIPHCWNIQAGQNGDKANFYEGPAWYRLHIKPDATSAGKSLFLKFDAAFHSADVFLNGKALGNHTGGFTSFYINALIKDTNTYELWEPIGKFAGKRNDWCIGLLEKIDLSVPAGLQLVFLSALKDAAYSGDDRIAACLVKLTQRTDFDIPSELIAEALSKNADAGSKKAKEFLESYKK